MHLVHRRGRQPARPQKTIIYCRMSLDATGQGLGIERQERECRELCDRNGWVVAEVFTDNDLSATRGKYRPGFESALTSEATRIVVWHTDRLVRLTRDLERVIELGVEVNAVTAGYLDLATPAGRAVAMTITVWAQYEGEQKAARQRAQQRQRVDAGKPWWSTRPFGYRLEGGSVVVVEQEAAQLREAYQALGRGETYAAITRRWNEAGSLSTKGRGWSANTVRQLLLSPRNAGLLAHQGEVIGPGEWQPIVDPAEWRAVTARAGNPAMSGRGQGRRLALLSGIATCFTCQAAMHMRSRSSKARGGPTSRKIYGARCGHATAPMEWTDQHVRKAVLRRLASPAMALAWGPTLGQDRAALSARSEADELRAKLDDLAEAYASGEITREQLARASTSLRTRLESADAVAERAYHPSPLGDQPTLAGLLRTWDGLEQLAQRAVIKSLLERIEVKPKRQGAKMTPDALVLTWRKF
jgi:site-specific DNA recombinase